MYRFLDKSPTHFKFTRFLIFISAVGLFVSIPILAQYSDGYERSVPEVKEISFMQPVVAEEERVVADVDDDDLAQQFVELTRGFEFKYPVGWQELSEAREGLFAEPMALFVDPANSSDDLGDIRVAMLCAMDLSGVSVEYSESGVKQWLARKGFLNLTVIKEPTGKDYRAISVVGKRSVGGEELVSRQWWLMRDDVLIVLFGETVSHEADSYGPVFAKVYRDFHFL